VIVDGIAMLVGDTVEGVDGLLFSETPGGNVFVEQLPEEPDRCVAVYVNGGFEADSLLDYDEPAFQFIVRSDRDPRWGLATVQAIYSLLHGRRNEVLPDGTYLVYALCEQSGANHLAPDERGRHQYSLNFRSEIKNPTAERPETGL
jgi:hypothetical protein